MRGPANWGDGVSCPGGGRRLKSATRAMQCYAAWGQRAVELLQCTTSLLGGSGQCNSCNALPHYVGAVGSGTLAMRGPTSWGDRGSYPGGGRCLKSDTPAMHCHTAWGL